ncbi:hypothetical protein [Enterococcus casseliflavus]|uniref:hypothetical protein n=1 Tax=Enterococcus casseliflavus TaxID=37734 RepID=UPI003D0BBC4D
MAKEKLQVYIDLEHREAMEELKLWLPVDESVKDGALIRYIIIDLLNRLRREESFEKKVLDSLSVLSVMTNAKLEQDHTKIQDLFSSDVYQEAVTMSKKIVRNKNYRFKNKKKVQINQENKDNNVAKEDTEKELSFEEMVAPFLHKNT